MTRVGKKQTQRYVPRPPSVRTMVRAIYEQEGILDALPPIRNTPKRIERALTARGISAELANTMTPDEQNEFIAISTGLPLGQTSGTIPELLTLSWLTHHGFSYGGEGPSANRSADFAFQYPLLGGKMSKNGSQADFFIFPRAAKNNGGTVLRIQGNYYHSKNEIATRDEVERLKLVANGFEVKDVWDYEATSQGVLDAKMRDVMRI